MHEPAGRPLRVRVVQSCTGAGLLKKAAIAQRSPLQAVTLWGWAPSKKMPRPFVCTGGQPWISNEPPVNGPKLMRSTRPEEPESTCQSAAELRRNCKAFQLKAIPERRETQCTRLATSSRSSERAGAADDKSSGKAEQIGMQLQSGLHRSRMRATGAESKSTAARMPYCGPVSPGSPESCTAVQAQAPPAPDDEGAPDAGSCP